MFPLCDCRERHAAQKAGEFLYAPNWRAWIFPCDPYRRETSAARYFAVERGIDSHDGEPYAWDCCPFCGLDLPTPWFEIVRRDDGEGAE